MNPITIHIRSDLNMPLGKTIAQAAHAFGLFWMQRCQIVSECETRITLALPVDELIMAKSHVHASINWIDKSTINRLFNAIHITDSGRTVFNEPTLTCCATSTLPLRDTVGLKHNENDMPFKQGFFIDRIALPDCEKERDLLIGSAAVTSSKCFIDRFNTDGYITLEKKEAIYLWLTSLFGKTVVGSKKKAKFDAIKETIQEKYIINHITLPHTGSVVGFVTHPIQSDEIQTFTRSNSFRLLD